MGGMGRMLSITHKGGTCVTAESRPHTWRLNHSVVVVGAALCRNAGAALVGNA